MSNVGKYRIKEETVEKDFEKYLDLVELKKEEVSETQYVETKRAFYAGFGMALLAIVDAASLPMDEAEKKINSFRKEVMHFWKNNGIGG